jgi:lysophospholipase L1-like esterase
MVLLCRSKWRIASSLLVAFVASVAMDRSIGLLGKDVTSDLLFPAHSEATYETTEFTFTASINGLGFRDREFSVARGADYRAIAIGDSFTYGWGVSLDESWPKVLEANLRGEGLRLEIANMGAPGAGPADYADTAEKAIRLLHPDLVIVGALQGDDLAQSEPRSSEAGSHRRSSSIARALWGVYPNMMRWAATIRTRNRKRLVAFEWRRQAADILARLSTEERRRFDRLDDRIRAAFVEGRLNASLIDQVIKRPDYYLQTLDLSRPEVQSRVEEMARQLGRIKRAASQYEARVVVVSVPYGLYVSPAQLEMHRRYGFLVHQSMLVSDAADHAIRLACGKAGLPFFTVADRFRNHRDDHLFYDLDGHFTVSGYRLFADQLTPLVYEIVRGSK